MGSLFAELARQASANARREVEAYTHEIPELGHLDADHRDRAETLEYALWLRNRTNELAPSSSALSEDDLGCIASMGEARAEAGMSLESRQQVLRLHTALMLREINEATDAQRGGGVDELMQMMSWFAAQGVHGIGAYCQGFVRVLRRRRPYVEQVALLAESMLAADPLATELAAAVGMELPDHCAVTVVRVPHGPGDGRELERAIEALAKTHQVPLVWHPQDGGEGGELIALVSLRPMVPVVPGGTATVRRHIAPGPVSDLVRDFAEALGDPCAAGTATAPVSELSGALDRARRVSRAAPLRRASALLRVHTLADVFVELAVAEVPFADEWLRMVARRLAAGPDLLLTLDAYYGYDMNRGTAAAALNVHPRTLDYRLRRVQELTGISPGSTHGVRILSSVVARELSGAWR
ncbi:helix-turn-helix domain-containing protein [Streptomyces sp. NPDC051597]|uniref:PucR family transcriptional regulator n=1 Tax=Streptomyces sp. NPDC051597 TaxID=3155049 RepID=UPI00341C4573